MRPFWASTSTTTEFFTHHILSPCLETFIRGTNFPRRLHLVQPKDPVNLWKQDGVVYKIRSCEFSKVYIDKMGRCIHEQIKEYDRDIQLSWTQTSATSEHANKTEDYLLSDKDKFIDQDPYGYSHRVKEAIHIRLHPKKQHQQGQRNWDCWSMDAYKRTT